MAKKFMTLGELLRAYNRSKENLAPFEREVVVAQLKARQALAQARADTRVQKKPLFRTEIYRTFQKGKALYWPVIQVPEGHQALAPDFQG